MFSYRTQSQPRKPAEGQKRKLRKSGECQNCKIYYIEEKYMGSCYLKNTLSVLMKFSP
jgi:hypothetical protein